jgi:hypothetical protein
MAIDTLVDLSGLSVDELYAVYLAIARSDHQWRLRTLYGEQLPPRGHAEFRPLSEQQFQQRLEMARTILDGETLLRRRLARQAAAYNVDVQQAKTQLRRAA